MLAALTPSHAVVIDHFDSPVGGQTISITNGVLGTSTSSIEGGLATIGGSWEMYVVVDHVYDTGNEVKVGANSNTSLDHLSYANDANVDTTCRLTWDALGGGLNTDVSTETGFQLLELFNDSPCNYTIGLQTFGGGSSTQFISSTAGYRGDITFPMAGFTGGADLTHVDRITLTISGGEAADVSVNALITVAEPAAAMLGGFGVLLLLRRRR